MNQPAYSGVDNYDSMIHCVCARVYVGIKCKRDQMLKKDEKRLCKCFPKYDDL